MDTGIVVLEDTVLAGRSTAGGIPAKPVKGHAPVPAILTPALQSSRLEWPSVDVIMRTICSVCYLV